MKRILLLFPLFMLCGQSFASHLLGGELSVQWIKADTFRVELFLYRNCKQFAIDPPAVAKIGIYDLQTNALIRCETLPRDSSSLGVIPIGNACFRVDSFCVENNVYRKDIQLPDNPHGYYISWATSTRNQEIVNIEFPDEVGFTWYAAIPDPALHNSTPRFTKFPRSFFCVNYPNVDSLFCEDADGDSLVYSLVVPYDWNINFECADPAPYPNVVWQPPYSLFNLVGGSPPMAIDKQAGVITAKPPYIGQYVFCVRVQEWTRGPNPRKLGEVRRDMQYAVIDCKITDPTFTNGSHVLHDTYSIIAGQVLELDITVHDDNDSTFLVLTSETPLAQDSSKVSFAQPATGYGTVHSAFRYSSACTDTGLQHFTFKALKKSCFKEDSLQHAIDIRVTPPTFDPLPNIFTPNGDDKNEVFRMKEVPLNYTCDFNIKIFNRWGELMFESADASFTWDGTTTGGTKAPEGVYFYIIEAKVGASDYKRRGTVNIKL